MDAKWWLIGALVSMASFMASQYFLRVENRLSSLHRILNWIHELRLRMWRVEKHLGLPPIDDDKPEDE